MTMNQRMSDYEVHGWQNWLKSKYPDFEIHR